MASAVYADAQLEPMPATIAAFRAEATFMVLALDEPRLDVTSAIDVGAFDLRNDVATATRRARREVSALALVDIDEADLLQKLITELLELNLV